MREVRREIRALCHAGAAHAARNAGAVPLRFVGLCVLEKGKPLATAVNCGRFTGRCRH